MEYISPKGVEEEGSVKFEIRAAIKPDSYFLRAGYSASGDVILQKIKCDCPKRTRDVLWKKTVPLLEIKTEEKKLKRFQLN
ncbi:MAG: hypothetical protein R2784_05130 [Saprospiraceae bacterium]